LGHFEVQLDVKGQELSASLSLLVKSVFYYYQAQ